MSREWKPGDVALVNDCTQPEEPWEPATCVAARTPEQETTWRLHRNGVKAWSSVSQARPLVVIDPEDREQVERLRDEFDRQVIFQNGDPDPRDVTPGARGNALQAALREFANPKPLKPDEPTDPAARVADRRDNTWRLLADGEWICVDGPDIGTYMAWDRLTSDLGPLEVVA